ncbi:MAG: hypothetical protein A3H96_00185 [Acidobacteria bacterium RIFCSPLOWO2_02_FULL_67_36]|nr:MAG: hypothetical protein A3H96_00185 [Acidobacteria bacterium RIFCSPLOWO2_02_FULL_67_36]OFW19607.1 MAG: hypothetical protein A3G21_21625 [Acidobacteria bacterium RIFCSPLOWO2_12_FULL_66_21]
MIRVPAIRFFLVVLPPPSWMRVALALAGLTGCAMLWLNPADVDSALGSVLLLQMFAASGGFMSAASRGHFDAVLVTGRPRWRIALGSLTAAAAPGAAVWFTVVLVAAALGRGAEAFAPQRLVAFASVSCVSWALGLALPPAAAGALWALVLVALALSRESAAAYLSIVHSAPATMAQLGHATAAVVVCPFLLLGNFPAVTDARVLLLDGVVAVSVTALGIRAVCRRDYSLAEPA